MSDRLAELVRQRALVQEHLAWLDAEIARVRQKSVPPESPVAALPAPPSPGVKTTRSPSVLGEMPVAASAVPRATPTAGVTDPDEILEQYGTKPGSVQTEVRKGCFLYFAAAFVLLGLGIAVLYFTLGSARR